MVTGDKNLKKIEDIFAFSTHDTFEDLHFKYDPKTGLQAVVAIHNTVLGPTLGGCRMLPYANTDLAIIDALRLARGMSYKSALAGLPYGGGKAVILKPEKIENEQLFFEAFGQFVQNLGGRYITAKDAGTTLSQMDIVATKTPYVASTSAMQDPSPFTTFGLLQCILATVYYRLGRKDLSDLHVVIQGLGAVGYQLAQLLHERGARLTVYDINAAQMQRCQKEFSASIVENPEDIYSIPCDIFAPCALGAILNDDSIAALKAKMVIGAANNQLEQARHGTLLREKGILYAPDYLVNSGGVIHAVYKYDKKSDKEASDKIADLYNVLLDIYEKADAQDLATNIVSDKIAHAKLHPN